MQQALIDGLAKDILAQVEGGDKEDVRKLVLTYLAKEAKRKKSNGEKISPEGFALVCVAKVLKEEDNATDVFRRFITEVREWRRVYPIALGGKVRWKKWFELPRKKGTPAGPSDEVLATIAAQNSLIAELRAEVAEFKITFGERVRMTEVGLTSQGEAFTAMQADFQKLEELATTPASDPDNFKIAMEFMEFLKQRK
jgi:hypothetical protein